jgi:hypothetical protein
VGEEEGRSPIENMRSVRQPRYDGKTSNLTISVYEGDQVLVEWMAGFLGGSKSDAVRTAIRHYAAVLQAISRRVDEGK